MQLKKLSTITILALLGSSSLFAENYVSVEYLQYDENNDRVSVMAPSLTLSMDIGTDYNIKADFVSDSVSGASPTYHDSGSGASGGTTTGDYVYSNQEFKETRNAGSFLLTSRLENRDELYLGADISSESDFESRTASVEYMHYTDGSHNRAIIGGIGFTFNEILNRSIDTESGASSEESSTSLNVELGLSQVLNKTSSMKLTAFAINDSGYLTNPHANVVRDYTNANRRLSVENRPDKRLAYGVDGKYVTKLSSNISYLGEYRYYHDDWNIDSHTLSNDVYYKMNQAFTLGTGLRYYTQSKANFYNGAIDHFSNEQYASSDERLSAFDALTYKASVDFKQNEHLSYNLGAEFYKQSTGLSATSFLTGVKYRY